MKALLIKSTLLSAILLLSACDLTFDFHLVKTWQNLSQENAQKLSESHLIALDTDHEAFLNMVHPQLSLLIDEESIKTIVEQTHFQNPQNILVTSVENGVKFNERDGYSASEVTGHFDCKYNHDSKADFYFTFAYDKPKELWQVIKFSIEECTQTLE